MACGVAVTRKSWSAGSLPNNRKRGPRGSPRHGPDTARGRFRRCGPDLLRRSRFTTASHHSDFTLDSGTASQNHVDARTHADGTPSAHPHRDVLLVLVGARNRAVEHSWASPLACKFSKRRIRCGYHYHWDITAGLPATFSKTSIRRHQSSSFVDTTFTLVRDINHLSTFLSTSLLCHFSLYVNARLFIISAILR